MKRLFVKIIDSDWFLLILILLLGVFNFGWVLYPSLGIINGLIGIGVLLAAIGVYVAKRIKQRTVGKV